MPPVVVVGSGASGVHFALTLLRKGYLVTMVDVGREGTPPVLPEATFTALKERLPDPAGYFLGARFEGVVLPDLDREYYGIPPSKQFVFDPPHDFRYSATGFAPLFSFARGGLGEVWTAGCYPFNDAELAAFPFGYADLAPYYGEVARRIGITGENDDLARFMPLHDHLLAPLRLDPHSETLLAAYRRRREWLHRSLRCYVGRTRVATLSRELGDRQACGYLGRCLWGCPVEALYTPSRTLRDCLRFPNFTYASGLEARYFRVNGEGRVTALVVAPAGGGAERDVAVDRIVLAAGTLSSAWLVLRSVFARTGQILRLPGLMDNRQLLVPLVNLTLLGRRVQADSYQYHLLGLGIETDDPADYVHGQITTLKTALMHPIIQQLPFDLKTSTFLARIAHAALGVVNLNFADTRRDDNFVSLTTAHGDPPRLAIHYTPAPTEPARVRRAVRTLKRALWKLGCFVPPGMIHVRPMGASVHYAGVLPMTREPRPWTTTSDCRSREFPNLYVVDGATFPFLPAKNITFTLMANAVRVAEVAFS